MPRQLPDHDAVEAAIGGDFLLFKHSRICPTSDRAYREWTAFTEAHPDVATGWIDVIAQRPISRRVAEHTGIRHESPQALLFRGGEVVWQASHHQITTRGLERAVGEV